MICEAPAVRQRGDERAGRGERRGEARRPRRGRLSRIRGGAKVVWRKQIGVGGPPNESRSG